ncbi:hypothetical protein [Leptospirillum ferriphilum]|uniref:hypothetical protein n=1 Tax=Leptospirillum ferriphilum TaxID=178606 RepID=UPI00117ABDC7|nr:hypothetical protein [Leptospirillum ferriphilum]
MPIYCHLFKETYTSKEKEIRQICPFFSLREDNFVLDKAKKNGAGEGPEPLRRGLFAVPEKERHCREKTTEMAFQCHSGDGSLDFVWRYKKSEKDLLGRVLFNQSGQSLIIHFPSDS